MKQTSDKQGLSDAVRPVAAAHLRQFSHDVRRRFPGNVTQVILFGSRARGDARRSSDYDVAVFVKELPNRRDVDHALADLAYPHILSGVHIRAVSLPDAFREAPQQNPLSLNISREGIEVNDA